MGEDGYLLHVVLPSLYRLPLTWSLSKVHGGYARITASGDVDITDRVCYRAHGLAGHLASILAL